MAITERLVVRVAALWAFAEATFWFILPDFFLLPAVIARPKAARQLVVAAFVGSTLGTLALAGLVLLNPPTVRHLIEVLPFTHPAMFTEVTGRIGDVWGVVQQPVSGIPAKVWTWVQVENGTLPFLVFLAVLWAARTLRFVAVVLAGEAIERVAGNALRRRWHIALAVYVTLFLTALIALTGI